MPSAGTSQRTREIRDIQDRDSEMDTQRHKRKRYSGIEDVFERQDPEEKARLGRGYRDMQIEADGVFRSFCLPGT